MASSVTIDVDSDTKDQDLQFQDIPHDDSWKPVAKPEVSGGSGKTHTFTNFPHSAVDSDDEDDSEKTEFIKEKKSASFWTFEYYQQFFDVETSQVGRRILGSMLPQPKGNYLDTYIRPNPDLYGPFWICTTLVFTTAIAGNLANYFQAAGQNYQWNYDFHKVTFAATAIFSYWWVIPFILFGVIWWRGNPARYTFLELICVYGYSLAIYIPISLLWVIQVSWLQWLLVVVGALLSGTALLLTVWPAVKEDKKQVATTILAIVFLLHAALALGFMLYFFHVPNKTAAEPINPANITQPSVLPQVHHNIVIKPDLQGSVSMKKPADGGGGGGGNSKDGGADGKAPADQRNNVLAIFGNSSEKETGEKPPEKNPAPVKEGGQTKQGGQEDKSSAKRRKEVEGRQQDKNSA